MARDRPRRALPLVAAWVAAAVVAVAVASWGVALVGRSVTDDRPAPLAAGQIEERLAEVAASSTSSTTEPDGTATTTTTGPDGATTITTTSGGAAPVTTSPAPTVTTSAGSPATTAPPPATTAPPPTTAAGETRTYTLVGGTAALRFAPTGVTVLYANPAQGFDVEIEPEHVNGVKVEFESETHRSRLDGWWDGGPRDDIEERADGD